VIGRFFTLKLGEVIRLGAAEFGLDTLAMHVHVLKAMVQPQRFDGQNAADRTFAIPQRLVVGFDRVLAVSRVLSAEIVAYPNVGPDLPEQFA
jgi:hypothetical protein